MKPCNPERRTYLLAGLSLPGLLALPGCASPLSPSLDSTTSAAARDVLMASAKAHGIDALGKLRDLSISYTGEWRPVVDRLQPALVDASFRQGSQERLLLREGLVAQSHRGPGGTKQVVRRTDPPPQGEVRVWVNDEVARDTDRRNAAALVADGYSLFLLGPMLLAGRPLPMALTGVEAVGGFECDVVQMRLAPGLGFSAADRIAMFIDRRERLMRRVRFTLDGLESTRGAIAEVETFDHVRLHGVRWPTRFLERLLRPLPLPVHDWRLTGLDVDRGMTASELSGPVFTGAAVAPAAPFKQAAPAG